MHRKDLRESATNLRIKGKTYLEISQILKVNLSKSTLYSWFRSISLPRTAQARLEFLQAKGLKLGRRNSLIRREQVRTQREIQFRKRNKSMCDRLQIDTGMQKAILAILYLAEGSKSKRGSLMFGNSDPAIIKLFVDLLRNCFLIEESRFRATVQCRADQNVSALQTFWSKVTEIPLKNFYKPQIDRRTIGKRTKKKDYKGVCRIDYFESIVDLELKSLAKQIEQLQYKET